MEQVFEKIRLLNTNEREELLNLIDEELKWTQSFANSHSQLEKLAQRAINNYQNGKTIECE